MARPCGRPAPDAGTSHLGPRAGGPRELFPAARLIGALLLLATCPAAAAPPPAFAPVRIDRREPGCTPGLDHGCAHVVLRGLRVRQLAGPAALAVQRQLDWALAGEEGVGGTPGALAARFIAEFASHRRQVPTAAPWFLERRLRLLSQRPRLLSFAIRTSRFAGGAHPASDLRFLDLDPRTGAPVELADLLVPGGLARLREVARQALRESPVVRAVASDRDPDREASAEEDDELALPDSVGVTDDALLLAWDAYELGPYATGPLTLSLELRRLRGLLRADGALGERR